MPNTATSISREIAALRRSLKAMLRSLQPLVPNLRAAISKSGSVGPAQVRRKLNLSPKRRAQLKVQAKYMVCIRQLGPKEKAEVREVLQKKGMPAAIARAQRLVSRIKAA